jgi:hypothetical protein
MFNRIFRSTKRWLVNNSENALEEAYQAALKIQSLENEYFQGREIRQQNTEYGSTTFAHFQWQLKSNLQLIKFKLNQFKTNEFIGNFLVNNGNNSREKTIYPHNGKDVISNQELVLERLKFIDSVITKYEDNSYESSATIVTNNKKDQKIKTVNNSAQKKQEENGYSVNKNQKKIVVNELNESPAKLETISDKTSILPRSFLRTIGKIKQEIDPKSSDTEEEVIKKFRKSRYKTAISIKFLLLLIIVPLLVHNLSKIALGQVFIEPYFAKHEQLVFLNQDLQEEALLELRTFEENLNLKAMVGLIPHLSTEEKEEQIKEKAYELAEDYRHRSANAIKNIFADILSVISFALILLMSKKELLILKSFIDELIYGLSDSAKAFLIILFTDMFVGFHSPHGWEIILESITRHFGLPENRDFNFLFIATFPVILDTVLKYWIFRYLNRISPSSVATYKNMNES